MRINLNTITNIAFTLACGVIVVLGGMQILERVAMKRAAAAAAAAAPNAVAEVSPVDMPLANAVVQGEAKAKVVLVEFSDFQCPFCAQYAGESYEQVKREFVTSGKVKYAFVNLPIASHKHARDAAEAGECANAQGDFWSMHHRLFANPQQLTRADLIAHAKDIGLDLKVFAACLGTRGSLVNDDLALASRMGVQNTPTFLIGTTNGDDAMRVTRKIVGARSIEIFRQALNDLLSEAKVSVSQPLAP